MCKCDSIKRSAVDAAKDEIGKYESAKNYLLYMLREHMIHTDQSVDHVASIIGHLELTIISLKRELADAINYEAKEAISDLNI